MNPAEHTSMAGRRAELLSDVADHITEVLRDFGIDTARAEQCGAAAADHLAEHWGGQVISIPKDHLFKLSQRDREILADRNDHGMSLPALAAKYGMGQRGIYKVLGRAARRATVDSQLDMFALPGTPTA